VAIVSGQHPEANEQPQVDCSVSYWSDLRVEEHRQAELVDRIAERIRRWGLDGLVSALLECARPFAFLGGQFLWVAQPTLSLLINPDQVAEYAYLLEQPSTIDLLRVRLEQC
jgi:hypothetical protein